MSLKRKIALNISVAFTIIFGIVMVVIYVSFNDFRRDEFQERFQKRLIFTINVIKQSKDFERDAPIFFDENSDNVLLNENIIIFNKDKKLIYSTIKDRNITWDNQLLNDLEKKKTIYYEHTTPENYAALRNINGENYYILTSAQDVNGRSKLDFLKYLLFTSYILSIILIWFLSYYLVSKFLKPLEELKNEISEITVHKLTKPVITKNSNDEIGVLAESFNTMTARLNDVFQSQKDFTSSAAHEIRTPLTRMAFQLENLSQLENHSPKTKATLQQMLQDVHQLSDLTKSLMLLSKFDKENITSVYEEVRIDEVVFDAFEHVYRNYPDFKMDFQIDEENSEDAYFIIKGVKSLLEITFINLFKNAAIYSDNTEVDVTVKESLMTIVIDVVSVGKPIPETERDKLFEAFMRGSNSHNILGSGLGLRIVKRILEYHRADIKYSVFNENKNRFRIIFFK